jgi:hypothetical protein
MLVANPGSKQTDFKLILLLIAALALKASERKHH